MTKNFELTTLLIRINASDLRGLSLHQRVQRALRTLILEGALHPGLKLPSSRSLAHSLSMARDTIENAYEQLHRDGFIQRRQGSGSYVSVQLGTQRLGKLNQRVSLAQTTPIHTLSQRGQHILQSGGVQDQRQIKAFATGLPETRHFPLTLWDSLQRQVGKSHREHILLHGAPQGAKPLRQAIATYLNLERGAQVSADQIIVLSSTRQALYLCAQLLVDAHQPILMENPGYFGAHRAFEAASTQVIPIDVDEEGLRIDLLRADTSGANCVYVTPSHQYPTGATLSLSRRIALTEWAAEKQGWIIEDDYDSEFHYEGLPTTCVQGLDAYKRTIYLGTFSKTLFPGLRIGYMAVPNELVEVFCAARSIMDGHTPQILQLTLARFMEEGHYNTHIRNMRKLYSQRRIIIFHAIKTHLADIVTTTKPQGGLHIACSLLQNWSESETIQQAQRAGLQLAGLSRLYRGTVKKEGWLLGYASLTDQEIEQAIRHLARAITN